MCAAARRKKPALLLPGGPLIREGKEGPGDRLAQKTRAARDSTFMSWRARSSWVTNPSTRVPMGCPLAFTSTQAFLSNLITLHREGRGSYLGWAVQAHGRREGKVAHSKARGRSHEVPFGDAGK